jgi:FkbM family methyltransferase
VPLAVRRRLHRTIAKKLRVPEGQTFSFELESGRPALELQRFGDAEYLFWLGTYESETMACFLAWAEGVDLVLDVGAHDGAFALLAAATNAAIEVVAFEPEPAAFAALQTNLGLNPGLNVSARQLALGDRNEIAEFYVHGGNSSLSHDFRRGGTHVILVEVARGDDFLAQHAPDRKVGLVKIDTESTEPSVLAGLARTIVRDRPIVVCEVLFGRSERQLDAFFAPHDYRTVWLSGVGPVERASVCADPTYRYPNYAFVPAESCARALVLAAESLGR